MLLLSAVALTFSGAVGASASTHSEAVPVHVQQKPSVTGNVHISIRATESLPPGGYYYYAVIVLKPYKNYTRNDPPPCATSSNMERTDYGDPHAGHPVELALTPVESAAGHWCRGGVYRGGIYAVPYPPPCNSSYPCRSEPYKEPCAGVRIGCVHGIVARPKLYSYPDGLPTPLAQGARIVDHFQVKF